MWESFDDVRAGLEDVSELPGPVSPETCPGWTWPVASSGASQPRP
jgi:hypothetical protein